METRECRAHETKIGYSFIGIFVSRKGTWGSFAAARGTLFEKTAP